MKKDSHDKNKRCKLEEEFSFAIDISLTVTFNSSKNSRNQN